MTDQYEFTAGPSLFMDGTSDWVFRTVGRPGIVGSLIGTRQDAERALRLLNEVAKHEERREEAERTCAEQLAAALAFALYDAHPAYGSTAGWRGGMGGQMVTQGCSFNDPPPKHQWMAGDALSRPLRRYVETHPRFNLNMAKDVLRTVLASKPEDE